MDSKNKHKHYQSDPGTDTNILASILSITDPSTRLFYIRQQRKEFQSVLAQKSGSLSDEELQAICANELALGILEKVQQSDVNTAQEDHGASHHAGGNRPGEHRKGSSSRAS